MAFESPARKVHVCQHPADPRAMLRRRLGNLLALEASDDRRRLAVELTQPSARQLSPVDEEECVQNGLIYAGWTLAATAAGLGTCPMEGFDESRVRKILQIPAYMVVVVIIPVGYSADGATKRSRMPLKGFVHEDGW